MNNLKFIDAFAFTINESTDIKEIKSFTNHLLQNKLISKQWLVNELLKIHKPKNTLILGAWYATLIPYLLFEDNRFTCVDIDSSVKRLNDVFNNRLYVNNPVCSITGDAKDFLRVSDISIYDTVINTSCEHMLFDMKDVIMDPTPIYVFQSNNYFNNTEHVNCKSSLDEFIESTGLNTIFYYGEMKMSKYTRFMVIGKL